MTRILFSSESVSEGHPDKIADRISDAVLDAVIAQDESARVACETMVKTGMAIVAGEISTNVHFDVEAIVREEVKATGYDNSALGFDGNTCAVLSAIGKQSVDIARGVDRDSDEIGAGDQGTMFGYACNETDVLMPAPITFAHRLVRRQAELRRSGELPWLRPDAKSQVTFVYEGSRPVSIHTVLLSTQHDPDVEKETICEAVMEEIIKKVLPPDMLSDDTRYLVNPTGRFVVGGPAGDCGLTGRKIIVDTYGGSARHGGGAFSGKDPTKVDRSAAYAARYAAKNIVAAGLADRCEIQIAYAIGVSEPISIHVNAHGTGKIPDSVIAKRLCEKMDFRPAAIIERFSLLRPIYRQTASYGHFGRKDIDVPWEQLDLSEQIKI